MQERKYACGEQPKIRILQQLSHQFPRPPIPYSSLRHAPSPRQGKHPLPFLPDLFPASPENWLKKLEPIQDGTKQDPYLCRVLTLIQSILR